MPGIRANGNPAAQLWKKVMSEAHENLPNQNFNGSTADMTQVTVCTRTGLLQGPGCTDVQTVWVAASNAPALVCDGHVAVNLCTESGKLATEYCPAECVQSVNAIDFTTENLTAAWGYERTTILLPLSAAEYEAYAAQQAADPTFVIPAGKPVQANDSGSVFSDLMMLGPCTLHQYVEPEPMPGEGYYDENGNWVPAGRDRPDRSGGIGGGVAGAGNGFPQLAAQHRGVKLNGKRKAHIEPSFFVRSIWAASSRSNGKSTMPATPKARAPRYIAMSEAMGGSPACAATSFGSVMLRTVSVQR